MYESQGGVCAICSKHQERRPLNVDHCHNTGTIRGLLCDKCNMAIGLLEDDATLLRKAQEYLNYQNLID
jgi:hypothetical protein